MRKRLLFTIALSGAIALSATGALLAASGGSSSAPPAPPPYQPGDRVWTTTPPTPSTATETPLPPGIPAFLPSAPPAFQAGDTVYTCSWIQAHPDAATQARVSCNG